jgi:hypothetical protein
MMPLMVLLEDFSFYIFKYHGGCFLPLNINGPVLSAAIVVVFFPLATLCLAPTAAAVVIFFSLIRLGPTPTDTA